MAKSKLYPGQADFFQRLNANVREAKTDNANTDCEKCGTKILLVGPTLVSMHVFVYPDAPHFTTKALCYNCLRTETSAHGVDPKTLSSPLN